MPANAILCVSCGYNLQTGRVMTTRYPDHALAERLEAERREAERREAERLASSPWPEPAPSAGRKKSRRTSSDDGSGLGVLFWGIGTMALAIAWFVGGLAVGYIFFYPPILFIIGLCTAFRGLFRMMSE
ncbi:MAG: hypothetical protein U1E05_26880 [Patescibacteria group bacterium]|nr:hypothetical protein [Patescibacteria group bacterium]